MKQPPHNWMRRWMRLAPTYSLALTLGVAAQAQTSDPIPPLVSFPEEANEDEIAYLFLPEAKQPPPPPPAPKSAVEGQNPPKGKITLRKFQKLKWSLEGGYFRSPSPVQMVYQDETDPTPVTLTAASVDYDGKTGVLKGAGGFQLVRADATFTGKEINYNFLEKSGEIIEGIVEAPFFRMNGKRLLARKDGAYVVENGLFTTCEHKNPDYKIRARQLVVSPNQYVSARGVTLYLGRTNLITLPSLRRNLRTANSLSFPRVGYNRNEGLTLRQTDSPIRKPGETLDYDARLSLRGLPVGFVNYQRDLMPTPDRALPPLGVLPILDNPLRGMLEQLTPPTFQDYSLGRFAGDNLPRATLFATLQNNQFVFNRNTRNLAVSRFPEVGVHFSNLLGRRTLDPDPNSDANASHPHDTNIVLRRVPNAPFLLDVTSSLGFVRENPGNLTTAKLGFRASVASQPILLGDRTSLRFGATQWINFYGTGSTYGLFSPEVDLNYAPTQTSLLGVGYRYAADWGRTPFFFDRRDIRHELLFRYQVGGPWAFGLLTRLDLERSRSYESEVAILRNFDCLQVGVGYRFQAQQFNFIVNLLPPLPNRNRQRREPIPFAPSGAPPTATTNLTSNASPDK